MLSFLIPTHRLKYGGFSQAEIIDHGQPHRLRVDPNMHGKGGWLIPPHMCILASEIIILKNK